MITLSTLKQYKKQGTKFSCLTCYDATFAQQMQQAQIDTILVGDSLGMVIQGHSSTIPVTVAQMAYHTAAVAKGNQYALIMADLPFMSYATTEDAIKNAMQLMQAGAHVVKLEGGIWLEPIIKVLTQNGIPVCAHLGLTPQSVNVFGGYKVQGKTNAAAQTLINSCKLLENAGAALLLLECVPSQVAATITTQSQVPVIGIGAGENCDGQVLVLHDILGITTGKPAKFVKNYMQHAQSIQQAIALFHNEVQQQQYPTAEYSFNITPTD